MSRPMPPTLEEDGKADIYRCIKKSNLDIPSFPRMAWRMTPGVNYRREATRRKKMHELEFPKLIERYRTKGFNLAGAYQKIFKDHPEAHDKWLASNQASPWEVMAANYPSGEIWPFRKIVGRLLLKGKPLGESIRRAARENPREFFYINTARWCRMGWLSISGRLIRCKNNWVLSGVLPLRVSISPISDYLWHDF